jgi:hypothetical protein
MADQTRPRPAPAAKWAPVLAVIAAAMAQSQRDQAPPGGGGGSR